jgi:hypothetical protein
MIVCDDDQCSEVYRGISSGFTVFKMVSNDPETWGREENPVIPS